MKKVLAIMVFLGGTGVAQAPVRTLDLDRSFVIQAQDVVLLLTPLPDEAECVQVNPSWWDCGVQKMHLYVLDDVPAEEPTQERAAL